VISSIRANGQTNAPKVTVLMAAYNEKRFIREAVESILDQTFPDFEFLIINDGSTDGTRNLLLSYDDPRIRFIDNEQNIGLVKSLNRGLALARGEYIARQDADDRSHRFRLEKQVLFMEANPDVVLLGTQVLLVNEFGRPARLAYSHRPVTKLGIRWRLMIDSAFVHSSVMFRRKVIWDELHGYNELFVDREDAELWSRVTVDHEAQNLSETLLDSRTHSASITANFGTKSDHSFYEIIRRNLYRYLQSETIPGDRWIRLHLATYSGQPITDHKDAKHLIDGFSKIFIRFTELNPEASYSNEIGQALSDQLIHATNYLATRSRLQSLRAFAMACRASISRAMRGVPKYLVLFLLGEPARQSWILYKKLRRRLRLPVADQTHIQL
jgi:glycosyltransferase involved in cell wall biosynthesis